MANFTYALGTWVRREGAGMIDELITELRTDPLTRGYAGMDAASVATSLNAADRRVTFSHRVNERDVLADWDGDPIAAEAFLQKLEAVAATGTDLGNIVKRAVGWMRPSEDGIDAGHPSTRAIIDSLVAIGAISQQDALRFKSLGEKTVSRAEELGLGIVTPGAVEEARRIGELNNG